MGAGRRKPGRDEAVDGPRPAARARVRRRLGQRRLGPRGAGQRRDRGGHAVPRRGGPLRPQRRERGGARRRGRGRPAATLRSVGSAGGQAAAFTYDLPQSVVLTRQGNPAWAGQERDFANPPPETDSLRSDDSSSPTRSTFARVQVPSADEQQRLLANLIIGMQQDRMPLPRFWYLPWGLRRPSS